jgi:hypothetical protein
MSANVDSGMTFMLIATRCFAAVGPADATDVTVTAAASTTSKACPAFTRASSGRPAPLQLPCFRAGDQASQLSSQRRFRVMFCWSLPSAFMTKMSQLSRA